MATSPYSPAHADRSPTATARRRLARWHGGDDRWPGCRPPRRVDTARRGGGVGRRRLPTGRWRVRDTGSRACPAPTTSPSSIPTNRCEWASAGRSHARPADPRSPVVRSLAPSARSDAQRTERRSPGAQNARRAARDLTHNRRSRAPLQPLPGRTYWVIRVTYANRSHREARRSVLAATGHPMAASGRTALAANSDGCLLRVGR